jgi:ribosomal protein L10
MKTRQKKEQELKKATDLMSESEAIIFVDISKIPTYFLNQFRRELKNNLSQLLVIKKRILNLALSSKSLPVAYSTVGETDKPALLRRGSSSGGKSKNINLDLESLKTSFGTVFTKNLELGAQTIYKFLSSEGGSSSGGKNLEKEKIAERFLGGYDLIKQKELSPKELITIGSLPPREVVLGQVLSGILSPIRGLMYILNEKAKRSEN